MANTRLQIGTNENVGYFANIPITIIYQIADIRNPENRKGSFSKTIDIPGNKETNILFENIFEANISLQTFDPRLKTEAVYYVDELPQIKGYIQLLNILKNETTGQVIYQCSLIGELTTLFTDIQGLYLTDLDFSEINHTLDYFSISGSWANTSGATFTSTNASRAYPLLDWGVNNSNLSYVKPQHFRLCLFARDILLKMFIAAGYTWESTFLDSDLFKRLVVTPTKPSALSTTVINNNRFLAEADGTETFTKTMVDSAFPLLSLTDMTGNTVNFQTETYDAGGVFATPTYTVATTNYHNIQTNLSLTLTVYKNTVTDVSASCTLLSGVIGVYLYQGSNIVGTGSLVYTQLTLGSTAANNVNVILNNYPLTATNTYTVKVVYNNIQISTLAAGSAADTWDLRVKVNSGSNFSSEFTSNQVYDGIAVVANESIPENVTQADFFKSIIRLFNLYVTVDKTNPKNYIIEPREDFYLTTARDWTYKHNENSVTEIKPVGELNYKKYKYRYKEDGDYFNKWHKETFKETYGYKDVDVTSDFVKAENMTDVVFSATPYYRNPYFNLVTGAILQKNNNIISEIKPNIRLLYYKQINLPNTQWTFTTAAGNYTYTNYPHGGHTDNPYNPTLDLNWGLPNLPYIYPNQYWTTNNLYNKYYSRYINQITDKDSKIVTTEFWLTPLDIHIFDFRYPIFWKDAYYVVNKLEANLIDYLPTKVELLKLTNYDAFTPTDIDLSGGVGGGNNTYEKVYNNNLTSGDGNQNYGNSSMIIGGSKNFIENGS